MKAAFVVRKATPEDAGGISGCLEEAFAPYRNDYTPEAFADTVLSPEAVRRRLSQMCLFVAVSEGEIVGTIGCSVSGVEGHLRGMAVRPEWQGAGVASALLRSAEAEIRENKCACILLDSTKPLQRAMQFYERHGYSASGRVRDFFGMQLFEFSKSI